MNRENEVKGWFDRLYHGKVFKIGRVFYLYYSKGYFWFRFFNSYGLHGQNIKLHPDQLFSERYGYIKYFKILGWKFKTLKR